MSSCIPEFGVGVRQKELIEISIVDDEECERIITSRVLAKTGCFRCVSLHGCGGDALNDIPHLRPDVVLMDIRMPEMSGIECAQRLKNLIPGLFVIFVTGLHDSATMTEALHAGGDGYLVKPLVPAQCLATIRFVTGPLRPTIATVTKGSCRQLFRLSNRENDVMLGIADGLRNKEIAAKLGMSIFAVEKVSRRIYGKLGVSNRVEAAGLWLASN